MLIDDYTPRQFELIDLLSKGMSNKEIADELNIAYGTVKQHLVVLFRKMAVSNRHKATLVAQRLVRQAERLPEKVATSFVSTEYKWRMLSAVAVLLPERNAMPIVDPGVAHAATRSVCQIVERKECLQAIHKFLVDQVDVLEGQLVLDHNGALLVCFGFPIAHTDDTDRALAIAMAVQNFAKQHVTEYPALENLGIGVSNQTEMIQDAAERLYGVDVFQQAISLATLSQKIRFPIMSRLSSRLSHMALRTGVIKPADSRNNRDIADAVVILDQALANADQQTGWGELPFMGPVAQGVANGIAQWVSVSSWPISSTASLIWAMVHHPALTGFHCVHLHLPARKSRHILLGRLMGQLELLVSNSKSSLDSRSTAGERLAAQITALCETGPLCLVVHGHNGLAILRNALTDKGIKALVTQPLLVVAQVVPSDQPEAVVQTLGSRANGLPFARSYVLRIPNPESYIEHLKVEAGAILDGVSPIASAILVAAAHDAGHEFAGVLKGLDEPAYNVKDALQELQSLGLIVPSQKGGFVFRDPVLAKAICQMDVKLQDDVGTSGQ